MANTKYELRTNDVQEIMRKPPHAFIARGNILILSALVLAFYFLNTFPLYERETVHFEIAGIDQGSRQDDSVRIALALNVDISKRVQQNQAAKLYVNNMKFSNKEYLNGRVDSIGYTPNEAPVLYFKCSRPGILSPKGRIGHIEIITKEKTFLSMLLDRFRI